MTKANEVSYENFDWVQLDKFLQFKITTVMAAELMGCCPATIKNYIKKKHDMTFSEYSEVKMSRTKMKLVQKAMDMAFNGNVVMTIFCLKNICNWSDKNETTHQAGDSMLKMAYDPRKKLDRPGDIEV